MNTNKNLKNQYDNYAKNTAPDMEKLWGRIEERVDNDGRFENKNNQSGITSSNAYSQQTQPAITVNKKKSSLPKWLTAGACVALVVVGARAFSKGNSLVEKDSESKANTHQENIQQGDYAPEPIQLSDLNFAYNEYRAYSDFDYLGDDYFVETAVLQETQMFAECVVTDVRKYDTHCVYTVEIKELYSKVDTEIVVGQTIKIKSSTPYLLNDNGEYLIPLRETEWGLQVVFENAPQIEFTQNNEVVYHNGWTTLAENSADCVFPEQNINDFYYDRMKVSYSDNVSILIEKWENI